MKRLLILVACVALGIGSGAAQKQRYSDSHQPDVLAYPLTVHVTSARLMKMPAPVSHGDSIGTGDPISVLHLTAAVDGRKIELEAGAGALLRAGDYRARVVSNDEKKSGWFSRTYELLFSDGTHVVFTQVSESE